MAIEKTNQLLGDYLIDAGLLGLDELREAATIARNQNLPIGKVLVMSGYLSKELLESTVELQSRVKDGQLDYKVAVQALDLIYDENISLNDAVAKLQQSGASTEGSNRLGEFLLGACLVSDRDLTTAKEESSRCGLPLGRVLVNLAVISQPVLDNVLNMQSLVRSGKITKEAAIKSLVADKEKQVESHPTLPNIAAAANQQAAGSISLAPTIPSGEQKPVRKPYSTRNRIKAQFPNLPILSLHHMLRAAGLLDTEALEKAIRESLDDPEIMTFILKRGSLLEDFVIDAAKQCCQLIGSGQLKPEQAIIALHHCQRTRNSLQDCLVEFGWSQSPQTVNS